MRPRNRAAKSAALRTTNQCARLALVAFGFLLAALAQASFTTTIYPEDICAIDSVYFDTGANYLEGLTDSGVRYKVLVNEGQGSYSDRYITVNPSHESIRIEFDQPVAAVGGLFNVLGIAASQDENAPTTTQDGNVIVDASGFHGIVCDSGEINEITFVTNCGPMSLLRLDVRPLPKAQSDSLKLYENTTKTYDSGSVLQNDNAAEDAILVSPPLHAAKFQLHDDGSFVYQPQTNYVGLDSFIYRATNGQGASASEPATVTIEILPTNTAPSFLNGGNVSCEENAGPQTLSWASQISSGSKQDANQSLTFEITNDNSSLFSEQPSLSTDGTLTYTPALYKTGTATVTVRLHDNGGNENDGQDTSSPITFTISIEPKEMAPLIDPIFDCAVRAGDALILQVHATAQNAGVSINYELLDAPAGATIDAATGQIVWRPSEDEGGQMPTFRVQATEMGAEQFSVTTTFRAEVLQSTKPPEVDPIRDIDAAPGEIALTHVKAHTNGEAQYFLAGQSLGATVDPRTGQFRWTPSVANANATYRFTVSVIDAEAPSLCTVRTFAVHVSATLAKQNTTQPSSETSGQAAMKFATRSKVQRKKI